MSRSGSTLLHPDPRGSIASSPLARALAALVLVAILGCVFPAAPDGVGRLEGAFFRYGTHRDMLRQISVHGILACGMTLVILSGGIDLSVGSVLGLSAVTFSLLTIQEGWPWGAALVAALAAGTLAGAISGGLVARFSVQPFIATLAMMVFARGFAKWLTGGEKISTYSPQVALPDGSPPDPPALFDWLDSRVLGGNVAVVTLVLLASVAICWVLLERTVAGRHLRAVGGSEEAARHSGVRVGTIRTMAHALCGLFAAIAGVCHAAQEQQGDPEAGQGYELTAIAMVVMGGTTLSGGRGGVALTLVGALVIGMMEKILSINAVGESGRLMLTGTIIVGAVLFQAHRRT